MLHPVADHVGDRHQLQPVLPAEFRELRDSRHGSVVVHHLANYAGRIEPRDARKIDGSLGLPRPHHHASVTRTQCVDVPRPRQVLGPGLRVGCGENRGGAVGSARAGGRPEARVDRLAKWRSECRRVPRRNRRQPQQFAALLGQRQADQPASVLRHEVDRFGGHLLRGHGQIAFVFAVFIVHKDDHAPLTDVFDGFFNRCKRWFVVVHSQLERFSATHIPGFQIITQLPAQSGQIVASRYPSKQKGRPGICAGAP